MPCDTITWTLVVQPGDAPTELLNSFPMTSGSPPAGWTTTGGSWAGASWGIRSEGCSAGLNYGPYGSGAANQYPQIVSNITAPANVEFTYEACLPSTATSGDDDMVFIPRYVDCQHSYMLRGDQWQLSDTCGGNSMLFYDTSIGGGTCPTTAAGTFTDGNNGATGVTKQSISCIQRNTWYSFRVRICNGTLQAKEWQSGTAEPGWQITTPGVPNVASQFAFQANQGDITFRNLNVYAIQDETNVTVTDNLPSCFTYGGNSCGGSYSGGTLTWNVGTLTACSTGVTCTITETIPSSCSGSFTNTAAVTSTINGTTTGGISGAATVNVGSFSLTKKSGVAGPVTQNGAVPYTITMCNTGASAFNSVVTIQDNMLNVGLSGLNLNGWQTIGGGNDTSTNVWRTFPNGAAVDYVSGNSNAYSNTWYAENIPAGACITMILNYQINGFPSEPCTVMANTVAIPAGSCGVTATAGPVTVGMCSTNTPTPTNTNTFTPTPTFTKTPTPTFTNSPTPTRTNTPTNTFTNTDTPTPTPTRTNTPTNTPSPTPTNSPTNSPTPTPTLSATPTRTNTPTNTPTLTPTPSPTPTRTNTPTNTPTPSPTNSPTLTPTNSPTPTRTNTPTNTPTNTLPNTPTNTDTNTPTLTPTNTPTPTRTNTPTNTNTVTPTNTFTNTATNTPTPTRTNTPTNTNTPTITNTPTNTAIITPTFTNTPTVTDTNTPTNTPTKTPTNTDTPTPTNSFTNTPTPTQTNTPTNSFTNTATPTRTNTPTNTNTPTPTNTPTNTFTFINTPTATNTPTITDTNTPTSTFTNTDTNTPTPTRTNTPTNTDTPTVTNTPTNTNIITPTFTNTPTNTDTVTPTNTPTSTFTNTNTPTQTNTPTNTATPTPTNTPTNTPTLTPTSTATSTFTFINTPTATNTPTVTDTNTPTLTPTNTDTLTPTNSPTNTNTPTDTPTPTNSFTNTPTNTFTFINTPTATNTPTNTYTNTSTFTPTSTATSTDTFTPSPTPTNTDTPTSTRTPTSTDTSTSTSTDTNTPTMTFTVSATNTPTSTATFSPTATPTPIGQFTVRVDVYNQAGEVIKQILVEQTLNPIEGFTLQSSNAITTLNGPGNAVTIVDNGAIVGVWDGTTQAGTPASNGSYYIKVDSIDPTGVVTSVVQPVVVSRSVEQITVKIYNEAGEEVKTLYAFVDDPQNNLVIGAQLSSSIIQPGSPTLGQLSISLSNGTILAWNGLTDSGQVVTPGQYLIEIHATNGMGGDTMIAKQVSVMADRSAPVTVWAYPNVDNGAGPVTFNITASTAQTLQVQIYDMAGELVTTVNGISGTSQAVWDPSTLASGLYIAVIVSRDSATGALTTRKTLQIVVQH